MLIAVKSFMIYLRDPKCLINLKETAERERVLASR